MKIGPTDGSHKVSHSPTRPTKSAESEDNSTPEDTIEISSQARARLSAAADSAMTDEDRSPGRIDRIRDKIAAGVYDRPNIAETIAERLADDFLS